MMSLQSWAQAILLSLPQSQQEPLRTVLHDFHRSRRREALSMRFNPRTGKTVKREPSEKQKRWWDFLEACEDGDLEKVRAAVESGVLGENEDGASGGLFSCLISGTGQERLAVADYLLQNGADIETEANANSGTGLLHAASLSNELETVRFLLQHGAKVDGNKFVLEDEEGGDDPNYFGMDETPFIGAAMAGHLEVMKLLLLQGANINAWCDSHGSALDCAASPEIAAWLQQRGATRHYEADDSQ